MLPSGVPAYGLAQRLESGAVWVNQHLALAPNVPFGWAKSSGIGTELSKRG